ncbi:MAG: hypothetical protein IJJ92_03040 [Clostridia bacterium]|nr:hypothetical protein [Clostridia bacterium]
MQSDDFKWYKEHLNELFNQYGTRFVAIKEQKVLGSYSTYAEAVKETQKKEELGSFIVQQCGKDESAYTVYISSINFVLNGAANV